MGDGVPMMPLVVVDWVEVVCVQSVSWSGFFVFAFEEREKFQASLT